MATPQSKRNCWLKPAFFAGLLACTLGLGVAVAQVLAGEYEVARRDIDVPEWLWAALFAGLVQGLVWYGAINSKLTWLMTRMDALEQRLNQHTDHTHHRASD